jgi:hypothetical protein
MKYRKTASTYAIIVGLGMIGIWALLLITGQDPQLQRELETIPVSISMAIVSDFLTAGVLLVAGIGLIRDFRWAVKVFLLSMGFLFYSVVNAAGYYGQRGDLPFVVMFAIIFILALVFTVIALKTKDQVIPETEQKHNP